MSVALQYTQKIKKRTNIISQRMGQDPRQLMKMRQVMGGPGGQQLAQSDPAQGRMVSTEREVLFA